MPDSTPYDIAIAGGGLAGLSLSIQLAKQGYRVLLLEKENYPLQRVCGEYISLESLDFLRRLGIDPFALGASRITRLEVSDTAGKNFELELPLGGFGISRYLLDETLANIARDTGVRIITDCKVYDIAFHLEQFEITTSGEIYFAHTVTAAFGKRSNLDVKWKRSFITSSRNRLNNYVGVKYHLRGSFPEDLISLHLFRDGYCGVVKVEDGKYNLCYLTAASNVIRHKGDLEEMEKNVLALNPRLAAAFNASTRVSADPVTIAQVSFEQKSRVHEHILMTGDAAGMIAPLCGNGMSMALHSSKIAAHHLHRYLSGTCSREEMEHGYSDEWLRTFGARLRTGRMIQRMTGHPVAMKLFVAIGRWFPGLVRGLIRKTHGKSF